MEVMNFMKIFFWDAHNMKGSKLVESPGFHRKIRADIHIGCSSPPQKVFICVYVFI
jgi:hypothetical protein